MREIKFRAWDTEEKKMLLSKGQEFILIPTMGGWGADKHYESHRHIEESCFDWASADLIGGRYEIMQYTGLRDKNGKEMYEGDILKYSYDNHGKVVTETLVAEIPGIFYQFGNESTYPFDEKECEVIGNIYENPELLGGKK